MLSTCSKINAGVLDCNKFIHRQVTHIILQILTHGSFTTSRSEIIFGPPLRLSRILISLLIFFFFTGYKYIFKCCPSKILTVSYFQNLNHTLGIACDINSFKYLTVFSTAQFLNYLIVFLDSTLYIIILTCSAWYLVIYPHSMG